MTTHLAKRDASEHELALFKEVFTASPDAIVVTDKTGRITAVNPASGRLFGYGEFELIGSLVEILIPEPLRANHPHHRSVYAASPGPRPMGTGLELYGRRKDGSEFAVDIMLSPIDTGGEQSILTV